MSGIQRRRSGVYEYRVMVPKALAKKPAPDHLHSRFSDLINAKTGCFKGEVARSLHTSDPLEAKKRGRRVGVELHELTEAAVKAFRLPEVITPAPAIPREEITEIAAEIQAEWLAWDEEQREGGDDRRFSSTAEERQSRFPDVLSLQFGPDDGGMELDVLISAEN
ncbi:DUF6538 domain-containing protein [Siculibacillus lacustris]|nr:DUF6538 domain-containing protein [Siculibacillus lacustris]